MYIGQTPSTGAYKRCDAITTSSTATYNLTAGSVAVIPETENNVICSLNGIIQAPGASGGFTISGSQIVFTSSLTSADVVDFILILGDVMSIGTPSDDSVTLAKMASGTDGNIISYDASGNPVAIATGSDGQLLTSAGAGQPPAFETLSAGKVLQSVSVLSSALIAASSVSFPEDDTIPQNSEGAEVMTLAITPVSATSKLHIFVNAFGSHTGSTRTGIALFVDSTAGALAFSDSANAGATTMMNSSLNHVITSANTSARTYKVRMAGMADGTLSFNGQSGARKFGGVASSSVIIMEIA